MEIRKKIKIVGRMGLMRWRGDNEGAFQLGTLLGLSSLINWEARRFTHLL